MTKALIYCRVSTQRQASDGHGIDGQESSCRNYATAKGYQIARVFKDEGISGGIIDRPGIDELFDYLDAHRNQQFVVIIDDIKRLARDVSAYLHLRKTIASYKATLESPHHNFEESPEGTFMETIFAATAELERNQNKKQVNRRMKARLEAGYWTFYQPPGYHYAKEPAHGKILVPKESEASIIREALEGFASGKYETQTDVLHFLHSKGFDHWKTGNGAHLEQVKRLLTREVYAGYISYPKWNVTLRKGHHEALISHATFQAIQDRLAGKKKNPKRKDINKDFPLRGFVLCAECKQAMTGAWTQGRAKKYPYYRCATKGCCKRNINIRKDDIEDRFETMLKEIKPRKNLLEVVRIELSAMYHERRENVAAMLQKRNDRLKEIKGDIDSYCVLIKEASNATVRRTYEEKIEELDAEKIRLGDTSKKPQDDGKDFEVALHRVMEFIEDPFLMWKTGDLEQQRLVLRMVFAEPLVYDAETGFYTATLSLPLKASCIPELDRLEVVEMPGIEPGSNVRT